MTDDRTRERGGAVKQLLILPREASTAVLRECGYEVKAMSEQNEFLALADQIEREGVKVYGVWHPEATVQSIIVAALRAHGAGREAVAWQFRQRSGVGKGPQSQHAWGDWCSIEREDYEMYTRNPNPLAQVRPLYATPVALERTAGREASPICDCAVMCQDLGIQGGCRYIQPARDKLRKLVDVVWNEATESTQVPSTKWADKMIDRVFPAAPSPDDQPAGCESAARSARIAIDKV